MWRDRRARDHQNRREKQHSSFKSLQSEKVYIPIDMNSQGLSAKGTHETIYYQVTSSNLTIHTNLTNRINNRNNISNNKNILTWAVAYENYEYKHKNVVNWSSVWILRKVHHRSSLWAWRGWIFFGCVRGCTPWEYCGIVLVKKSY